MQNNIFMYCILVNKNQLLFNSYFNKLLKPTKFNCKNFILFFYL